METANELHLSDSIGMTVATEKTKTVSQPGWFTRQAMAFEESRYGWMAIMLTFQSCLGSIACMFILYSGANIFLLATCAAITMGSNAMFIGLASPKVCLFAFYLSVVLNTVFCLLNFPI